MSSQHQVTGRDWRYLRQAEPDPHEPYDPQSQPIRLGALWLTNRKSFH
jgi:hypothetical protein